MKKGILKTQKNTKSLLIQFGILLMIAEIFVGCASTRVGLFTNPPGAKVFGKPLGSGRFELLGETPITVSADQIEKAYKGSGPVLVEFRKEGFQTHTVLVTELSAQDLNINAELVALGGLEDLERVNYVIDSLFECLSLIHI